MLAERLRTGEPVVGTMLRVLHHPALVPILQRAGFDFIMLDLEHGTYDMDDLSRLTVPAQAAGLGIMVRVPELTRSAVCRALDLGVDGVMVPMLETPEQAKQFADWAKYPPLGGRGLSSTGGHTGYQSVKDVVSLMASANEQTLTIAQVETTLAVEHADAIAATPGIDALLVGPNDLAVSLGNPGVVDSPEEEAAIETLARAALDHDKLFGMHAGDELLRRWIPRGMTLVMNSIDVSVLNAAYGELNARTRALL